MARHKGGHPGRRRLIVSDETPDAIVCMPTSQPAEVEGSTRHRGDCGHDVWLAPSGRKILASNRPGKRTLVLCSPCGHRMMAADPELEVGVTPDQLTEMKTEFGKRSRNP